MSHRRCTRYRDCQNMDHPFRWLPFDSHECIGIFNTSLAYNRGHVNLLLPEVSTFHIISDHYLGIEIRKLN